MIQQTCELLGHRMDFLGFLLAFFGSFFQLLYLSNVEHFPLLVLGTGVAMVVLGTILLYKALEHTVSAEPFLLFAVYTMCFSLAVMPFVRFSSFSGTDNLREYRVAQIASAYGWNTPTSISIANNLECQGYLSCLSTTFLPSVLSSVTGLSLLSVFEFGLSAVISFKPVLVYLNVKEIFGKRDLAALSAILYPQLYFNIFAYNMRDSVTTELLLFTLLVFFKILTKNRGHMRFLILLCFLLPSVVVGYYTTTYSLIAMLFALVLVMTWLLKLSNKKPKITGLCPHKLHLTLCIFVFLVVLSLAWFSFVPTSPFIGHLTSMIRLFKPAVPSPAYDLPTQFLAGSPLGPLIDNWFRLGVVLAGAGFLLLSLTEKKTLPMLLWLLAGALSLIGFLVAFVPYVYKVFGGFTRVYHMGYIFLCVFVALTLLNLGKRAKGIVLILYLMLNLPMNMLLPLNYRYVLYNPESLVQSSLAVTQSFITSTEFRTSVWIRGHLPTSFPISADQRGIADLYYTDNELYSLVSELNFNSQYLFLHRFAVKYGLWVPYGEKVRKSEQISSLISSNNVLYSNGEDILLGKVPALSKT